MPTHSTPRGFTAARIWGMAALILVVLWTSIVGADLWLAAERNRNARQDVQHMAQALALQSDRLLQSVEVALRLLGQRIVAQGIDPDASGRVIEQNRGNLPTYLDFGVFDARGVGVAATVPGFAVGRSYADRDYFRAHLERDDLGLHVAAPIIGRASKTPILPVSLRLADQNGRFLGVLMAAVYTRPLAETYGRFSMGERKLILLLRAQPLQIVARAPEHDAYFGREVAAAPIFAGIAASQTQGVIEGAAIDGIERLAAWQRVGQRPLYAAAGIARADIEAAGRSERLALYGGGLLASVSLLALAFALVRAQARVGAALAEQRALAEARAADAKALAETADSLNRAQAVAHIGSWQLDVQHNDLRWTTETYRIFGIPEGTPLTYELFLDRVHPDDRAAVDSAWQAALQGAPYDITHRIVIGGEVKWVREQAELSFDTDDKLVRGIGTVQDVTEQVFDHIALEESRAAAEAANRANTKVAVMFVDMDRFKVINDTLGHQVGDAMLVEVARRLKECVRESDIVARLGGDEFVVVLAGMTEAGAATPIAGKILNALGQPYEVAGHTLHSSPSIGISVYPLDGTDIATLMKNADTAMYHAKAQGRNNVQYFTAALNENALERLELERALRTALEERQFELHYQPQVCAASGCVCGVEALVRWRHPERGLIPPDKFIPIAEETGLIEPLGAWVLDEACRQLAAWRAAGIDGLCMAVNLSARQLRSPCLVDMVRTALTRHALREDDLELEITESAAMTNPELAIDQLHALRTLGVRLAIDDFGTGYSSLAYLKNLPIQVLKLDRSFVNGIESGGNDAVICAATIALAHSLGLKVVAEGVETQAQQDFLAHTHHCDLLQGYLFGKPLRASELTARLNAAP